MQNEKKKLRHTTQMQDRGDARQPGGPSKEGPADVHISNQRIFQFVSFQKVMNLNYVGLYIQIKTIPLDKTTHSTQQGEPRGRNLLQHEAPGRTYTDSLTRKQGSSKETHLLNLQPSPPAAQTMT